jgi:hypothetical protein
LSKYRTWLGNGDHPDIQAPEVEENAGLTALFPTETAEAIAPLGAEFIAAVATSPRPGSDIRDGYFIGPSPSKKWKWVLWDFTFDDNWETWSWIVCATSDEPFKNSMEAARSLLPAVWAWQRDTYQTTPFEEVEDTGLLDEDEVWRIGESVFEGNSTR